jgi:ASC-1-like (ASCH) protein
MIREFFRFKEKNLEKKEKMIQAFKAVRDLPYSICLNSSDPDSSCFGKHVLLKKKFYKMGIESRFGVCTFK